MDEVSAEAVRAMARQMTGDIMLDAAAATDVMLRCAVRGIYTDDRELNVVDAREMLRQYQQVRDKHGQLGGFAVLCLISGACLYGGKAAPVPASDEAPESERIATRLVAAVAAEDFATSWLTCLVLAELHVAGDDDLLNRTIARLTHRAAITLGPTFFDD